MSRPGGICKPLLCLAAALCLCRCGTQTDGSLSADSREMMLVSDYTEIAIDASKVPGYWARQIGDGKRFFLYTLDRGFRNGETLIVDGPGGLATASVFDDKTRIYESDRSTPVIVVRRAARSRDAGSGTTRAGKGPGL